jgi:hypothetical protein
LTQWNHVDNRFAAAAAWAPYSKPWARNDLDSLEVGNGGNDGLTLDERKAVLTLWSMAASPLIVGADLTELDPDDLALLTNDEVLAVDQAGVAGRQLVGGTQQVWSAPQPDGSVAIAFFNLGAASTPVSVTWSSLGVNGPASVRDLWSQADVGLYDDGYTAQVPSHGTVLVKVTP